MIKQINQLQQLQQLFQNKQLYCYGAGFYLSFLLEKLKQNQIPYEQQIKGIMVGNKNGNPDSFCGIPVVQWNDVENLDGTEIILTLGQRFFTEIENTFAGQEVTLYAVDYNLFEQIPYEEVYASIEPFVEQFKRTRSPESNDSMKKCAWVCWWQGEESAPDIVKACMESQRYFLPKDVEYVVITQQNYNKYIEIPDYIMDKVKKGYITLTTLSDMIRVSLLYQYGGLWMDSTLLLTDYVPEEVFTYPVYTRMIPEKQFYTDTVWAGWFMAARAGNRLFAFVRDAFYYYYQYHDTIQYYLTIDYFVAIACNTFPEVLQQFKNIPFNNENALELTKHLKEPYREENYNFYCRKAYIQKLTYKLSFDNDEEKEESIYNRIIKQAKERNEKMSTQNDNAVIIYGAGFRGGRYFLTLAENNIHVEAFCDRDADNIPLYFGCSVYTMKQAVERFPKLAFVVALDNESAREQVTNELKGMGIEVYHTLAEFFQGEIQEKVNTVICGSKATFQIAPQFFPKDRKPLIYSFGIGFDDSYERELAQKYGAEVYAFDPSPEVIDSMKREVLPEGMQYFPWGLSDQDIEKEFFLPSSGQDYSEFFASWTGGEKIKMQCYRLKTIVEKFGHTHLDLLKMDIEGSEFMALPDIFASKVQFDQLCIETHSRIFADSAIKMRELRKLINDHGYVLISNGVQEQTYIRKDLL